MPCSCCIIGCSNKQTYDGYSLFGFPNDPHMKNQWLEAIGLDCSKFKSHYRVCEVHFKPEVIHFVGSRKELDKSAVPSLFCDCDCAEVTGIIEASRAAKSASNTQKLSLATTLEHSYSSPNLGKPTKKERDFDVKGNIERSSLSKKAVKHSPDCNVLRVPLRSTPKSLPNIGSSKVSDIKFQTIVPVNIPKLTAAPFVRSPSNSNFKKIPSDNRKLRMQLQNALDENAKLKRELSMLKGIFVPVRPVPMLKACKNLKFVHLKKT